MRVCMKCEWASSCDHHPLYSAVVHVAVDDLPCPRVQLRPRHHARVVHGQQTKARRVGAPEALVGGLRVLERFDGPILVVV